MESIISNHLSRKYANGIPACVFVTDLLLVFWGLFLLPVCLYEKYMLYIYSLGDLSVPYGDMMEF